MSLDQRAKAELTTPTDREIATERIFDAPRELVWAALTDPALIPRWWGLKANPTVVDQLDLTPGGAWRFVQHNDDGSLACFRGIYREITPPERLVYTFEWEGLPGHVLISTATLEDLGGTATRLRVSSLFHTSEERDGMIDAGMERGLNEGYEQLDELLAELG
jgi:uncharacterized protein YndB with AHSA1/START domain